MKVLAINGSPRRNMNTAQLLEKVVEGALSENLEAELLHLRDYRFSGCVSCLKCKEIGGASYGRCVLNDELRPVLNTAHEADILVMGTPFYFCTETALYRAFQERLWFQYYLYSNIKPPLSPRKKEIGLFYTMNIKEEDMEAYGKTVIVNNAKRIMELLFGPATVFLCTDTKQTPDYSKYEMDRFDVAGKLKRHEEVFPQDLAKAFAYGAGLAAK